jgi:hypothetical protein
VSLNYDLRDVQENEHTTSEETHNDGTIQKWGRWTETLIFATMAVDMGEITEKNYQQFYQRHRWFLRAAGINPRDYTDAGYSEEVVKAHIGLKTNVFTTTEAAYKKRLLSILMDSVDDEIRRER